MSEVMKRLMGNHNDYRREIQIRSDSIEEDDKYYYVEGKAVTFDEATVLFNYGGNDYKEVIARAAFDNADISNVFLKFNHESSVMAVARTKNHTLEIEVRDDGVYIKAKLSKKLSGAVDLYNAISEGLIDKMSFAFTINEESFNEETLTWTVRSIGTVYDVAAVEIPAYDNTYIYARRRNDVEARMQQVEAVGLENLRAGALAVLSAAKQK